MIPKTPKPPQGEPMEALTAYEKFKVGQRVEPTQAAIDANLWKRHAPPIVGHVRGFSQAGRWVRVQLRGLKTPGVYHPKFWQPIAKAEGRR